MKTQFVSALSLLLISQIFAGEALRAGEGFATNARSSCTTGSLTLTARSGTDVGCERFGSASKVIELEIAGGSPPYQIASPQLSGLLPQGPTFDSRFQVPHPGVGTYTFTVTDAAGTSQQLSLDVTTEPADVGPRLEVVHQQNPSFPSCQDGSITIAGSGAFPSFSYRWDPPISGSDPTLTGLTPGIYSVIVSDSLGCAIRETIELACDCPDPADPTLGCPDRWPGDISIRSDLDFTPYLPSHFASLPPPQGKARSPFSFKGSVPGSAYEIFLMAPRGAVRIAVPVDLRPGDAVSGSVEVTSARGEKDGLFKNLRLAVGGREFPLSAGAWSTEIDAAAAGSELELSLRSAKGKVFAETAVPILETRSPGPAGGFYVPGAARGGRLLAVVGEFDGDLSTTEAALDGQPARVVAETPRLLTFALPSEWGRGLLVVKEAGRCVSGRLQVLGLNLESSKPALRKGDRARLELSVTGLEGLDRDVEIELSNQEPSIVELAGGDRQKITIRPADVRAGGEFSWSQGLRARKNGVGKFQATVAAGWIALSPCG